MSGDKVLQATAIIDIVDKTSGKIDLIAKKLLSLSRLTKTVGQVEGFNAFDRVARGLERGATAAQALDRSLSAIRGIEKADRIAAGFDRAANAMKRANSEAAKMSRSAALGVVGGLAAEKVAHAAGHGVHSVVETYKDFDDKRRYQKAILGLTDEQQKPFIDQALRMGAHTPFNDIQVLEAQLDLAQRGVDQRFIRPIVEMAADYAQAMNAQLPEAAKTIEGILFSTGKHMTDMDTALKTAQRVVDYSVKLGKIGGLDNEDIKQFFKYGGQPGSVAGFSDPVLGAMAAMMRRSNIRGDEAGVAVRSFASHLVAPTRTGVAALQSLGVDYNKFVKTPGALSPDNLDMMVATNFGRHLTQGQRKKLSDVLTDGETIGNREDFISKVTGIVGETFDKTKKGELKASDSAKIAKVAGKFWQMSLEGIDTEGLLRAVIASNPTIAQANAIFGAQQGGRFMSIGGKLEMFDDYVQRLATVTEGFAKHIGEERMAGFSGALTRAEGAVKNFETAIGRANDGWATKSLDVFSAALNAVSKFDQATLEAGTALTALAGLKVGFEALARFLPGLPKPAFGIGAGALVGGYLGYEIGDRIIRPLADVAGGKYWSPSDAPEADQLAAHLAKIEADMAKLAEHSKDAGMLETILAPMKTEAADIRNRLADAERRLGPSTGSGAFLAADPRDLDPSIRGAQDLARIWGPQGAATGSSARDLGIGDVAGFGDGIRQSAQDFAATLNSAFTGALSVTFKVEPSPLLEARLSNIEKSAAERVNATGPGSTGRDGTNIDQHQ